MGLLRRIFSNNDAEIIDGAKRGIDALVFTDEERSTVSLEAFSLWIEYMKATSGQNLARRVIAFMVVTVWLVIVLACVTFAAVTEFFITEEGVDPVGAIITVIDQLWLGEAVLAVIVFYFGKHLVTNWQKAANGK